MVREAGLRERVLSALAFLVKLVLDFFRTLFAPAGQARGGVRRVGGGRTFGGDCGFGG